MKIKRMMSILNVLLLIFSVMSTSAFKNVTLSNSIVTITTLVLLVILDFLSLFFGRITVRELFLFGLMLVIACIVTYESESTKILMIVMYIFACRLFTIRDSVDIFIISKSLTLIFTFVLYISGYLNDINNSTYGRHSFGFGHPNTLGATILILEVCLILWFFLAERPRSIEKWISIIIQIPLMILVYMSRSRGTEIGIIVMIVMTIFILLFRRNIFPIKFCSYISVFGIPLISIIISKIFLNISTGGFMEKINTILSARLYLSASMLEQYGVQLFGQKINYNFNLSEIYTYSFLDNAYMELLIHYGVISLLFMIGYHYLFLKKGFAKKLSWISILIVTISVYAFVEQGYDQFWVNPAFTMSGFLFSGTFHQRRLKDKVA